MSGIVLSKNEKKLLLLSVNYYIEKIEFNIRNYDTMFLGGFGRSVFESDLEELKELRDKLFSVHLYCDDPDVLSLDGDVVEESEDVVDRYDE